MTSPLSTEEMKILNEAKELMDLRKLPAFNRIMLVLKEIVEAAHIALVNNPDPRMNATLLADYRARQQMFTWINEYIESVVARRRSAVNELLQSVGVSEELIAKHIDDSLDFLMPQVNGGPNARTK